MASKKTSVTATLAALALIAVGSWLGVDLSGPESAENTACPVDTLPPEARPVIDDILSGGPYAHPGEDGGHFGNYEGLLPEQRSSYYRSFTVDTPGLQHRGLKRIVVGGGTEDDPDVWYYTDDHYGSFCEIPDAED